MKVFLLVAMSQAAPQKMTPLEISFKGHLNTISGSRFESFLQQIPYSGRLFLGHFSSWTIEARFKPIITMLEEFKRT